MKLYIKFSLDIAITEVYKELLTKKATTCMMPPGARLSSWPKNKETRGVGDLITISSDYKNKTIDRTIEIIKVIPNRLILENTHDPYATMQVMTLLKEENKQKTHVTITLNIKYNLIWLKLIQLFIRPSKAFMDNLNQSISRVVTLYTDKPVNITNKVTLFNIPIKYINFISSVLLGLVGAFIYFLIRTITP